MANFSQRAGTGGGRRRGSWHTWTRPCRKGCACRTRRTSPGAAWSCWRRRGPRAPPAGPGCCVSGDRARPGRRQSPLAPPPYCRPLRAFGLNTCRRGKLHEWDRCRVCIVTPYERATLYSEGSPGGHSRDYLRGPSEFLNFLGCSCPQVKRVSRLRSIFADLSHLLVH